MIIVEQVTSLVATKSAPTSRYFFWRDSCGNLRCGSDPVGPFDFQKLGHIMWVKQCHLHHSLQSSCSHPAVITISIAGINLPFPVMGGANDIVLATLHQINQRQFVPPRVADVPLGEAPSFHLFRSGLLTEEIFRRRVDVLNKACGTCGP